MKSSIEKAAERLKKSKGSDHSGQVHHMLDEPTEKMGSLAGDNISAQVESKSYELEGVSKESGSRDVHHLDMEALKKNGILTPDQERTKFAEEFRMIKRPLLMNAFGKGAAPVARGNMIMVTSAMPGEGKTYNALNLAMSMTMEMDSTVLLVDSDVVKPSLTGQLGLEGYPGLIDLLLDSSMHLGDVIINTDIPRLRVLPAGKKHVRSTELLASEQMNRIATELSERYSDRIILFDAPPLLATTEATVLAHLVGQILLIVEAGKTSEQAVKEAISLLNKDKVIGTVLNKSRGSFGSGYYGGYYGGGYYGSGN